MTVEEVARAIAYARKHPGSLPREVANAALVTLADLVTERVKQQDVWKDVMRRSPPGRAGPELSQATTNLMRAEEAVCAALGYEH